MREHFHQRHKKELVRLSVLVPNGIQEVIITRWQDQFGRQIFLAPCCQPREWVSEENFTRHTVGEAELKNKDRDDVLHNSSEVHQFFFFLTQSNDS